MKVVRVIAAFALAAGAGCGAGSSPGQVVEAGEPVEASPYLREAFAASPSMHPTVVGTGEGLVLLGGVRSGDPVEGGVGFDVLDGGVLVRPDGVAEPLPDLPSGPLIAVSTAASGDHLTVAGRRCDSGVTGEDAVSCDGPGGIHLLTFDLPGREWEERSVPDAARSAENVELLGGSDGLLVLVARGSGSGQGATWVSLDGGRTWSDGPAVPAGHLCATGGSVYSFRDRVSEPEGRGVSNVGEARAVLQVDAQRFDPARSVWADLPAFDAGLQVVDGASIWSCLPKAGLVIYALTGDGHDTTVVRFHDRAWASFVVEDEGGLGDAVELDDSTIVAASVGAPTRTLDLVNGRLGAPIGDLKAADDLVLGAVDEAHVFVVDQKGVGHVVDV